ncbi:undecaprenyldiphospho-muramoylpentapeptide beta-N-acetylglucosaminyltransferase [Candidatus Falkowbacteria bacterium CG10_big_fil_rev_8_21_14_0_10_43_11]|uniref:UDP-N-acetylglucosamine--N-acetylmuramyl-(pentapeptide) pyrophosphoryl-undecaprenol N-acetylglucosamine transferase n=1 Tax=Candidatus Falkowbacteria bacterium CG10_big_fil_rev_8_21_14_0_10_43_11 TaxID=1974568 RepID=A0A2M6WMK4_9BACT|nr:MAG: undecaprenyldiphospho-muramoylpentapeptide beta-N-acetylglucosaminyltransferase [Candidatus Falkowbacteria bacterium CG10_big_fil_rev_8_21_14_0_10_43_11]
MQQNISNGIKMKILLTGGGTGGSVTPLLAVFDELRVTRDALCDFEYLWVGTKSGPEKEMVAREGIEFKAIAAGKFRRYFSARNLIDPFFVIIGFFQSLVIILKFKPDWIITAGGFVSVPVFWVGWLTRKKMIVHQQDVRAGLANKLMAPLAKFVTVTFEKSLQDYGPEAKWIGNPVRGKKLEVKSKKYFNLAINMPVLLILGGGTGSAFINKLVLESLPQLTKICQIIHVTGKGKQPALKKNYPNYYPYEFLNTEQMAEAYAAATIVVSRCGLATLSELSYFGKPAILIYLPGHQEYNARVFEEYGAAIVLDQPALEKNFFIKKVKKLLADKKLQADLSKNISEVIKKGAAKELAKIILKN